MMADMNGPTIDQRRARHAWEAVARIKGTKETNTQRAYLREVKRFPVRTLTAGLGHALAFLDAKSGPGDASERLLSDLADWVINNRMEANSGTERPPGRELLKKIVKGNGAYLQLTTDEVLAYMLWLTRFAEAELEEDDG